MMTLAIWEALAAALVYSCFCRASFTHKGNTRRDIRWAFTFLGVMALLSVLAPFWGYDPDGFTVALLGSITVVQITTSYHWRRGVPEPFRRTLCSQQSFRSLADPCSECCGEKSRRS